MTTARHGLRLLLWGSARLEVSTAIPRAVTSGSWSSSRPSSSWICRQCQSRPLSPSAGVLLAAKAKTATSRICHTRNFSSGSPQAADPPRPGETQIRPEEPTRIEPDVRPEEDSQPVKPINFAPQPGHAPAVDQDTLPSHSHSRRSDLSKRLQVFMDGMLAKAAVAGQKVNTYTGTDYSGIEALRQQIVEQEQQLKSRLAAVNTARDTHAAAHASQAASQKEVVSLLERKTSWSPSDLDRYTSLIRSEHLHEQSVTSAKQALAAAEKTLEEARAELERKERKQYHEEQIWSDTIRRNSTWVTFGLMGFNILLLIANIGIFEPWRRRRMVREVKAALDQKTMTAGAVLLDKVAVEPSEAATATPVPPEVLLKAEVEKQIDHVTEPTTESVETLISETESEPEPSKQVPEIEVKLDEAAVVLEPLTPVDSPTSAQPFSAKQLARDLAASAHRTWLRTRAVYSEWFKGPLSDDPMTLTKAEVTSVAVEGVAVGLAIMACVVSLLRQH